MMCSAEGNPYLREHRVFRGAKEGLDPQILLDPFEELLNLPSLFIKRSYFSSFQMMRVSEEAVFTTSFLIYVFNQPKRSFDSFEPDLLIVSYSNAFSARTFGKTLDIGIFFQPGHEKDTVPVKAREPSVIIETAIKNGE